MPREILFSLLDEIQNTKNQKKGILKKSKKNRVSCFNIYTVLFAFLSTTVEEGSIWNFRILLAIHSGCNMILDLFQTNVLFYHLKIFSLFLCSTLLSPFQIDSSTIFHLHLVFISNRFRTN